MTSSGLPTAEGPSLATAGGGNLGTAMGGRSSLGWAGNKYASRFGVSGSEISKKVDFQKKVMGVQNTFLLFDMDF